MADEGGVRDGIGSRRQRFREDARRARGIPYAVEIMTRLLWIWLGIVSLGVGMSSVRGRAQGLPGSVSPAPTGASRVVVLWPGGAPGALGTKLEDVPRLYVYPAAPIGGTGVVHVAVASGGAGKNGERAAPRTAVVIFPGGGYRTLVMEKEGASAARWLNARGVTAMVVQYRLGPRYHYPAPMLDGARAVRYVRSHAAELGVAGDRVGVWGFSAGGHLAGFLATADEAGDARSQDPVERVSARPDFAILCYARLSMDSGIPRKTNLEALVGEHPAQETMDRISIERHVTQHTSPAFIFSTGEDETVNSINATVFYNAMKRAEVPAEVHVFERGPHGVGLGLGLRGLPELGTLSVLLENWMEVHGWMGEIRASEQRR